MDAEHWNKAKDIFAAALERDFGHWDAFIREACGADDGLRVQLGFHDGARGGGAPEAGLLGCAL